MTVKELKDKLSEMSDEAEVNVIDLMRTGYKLSTPPVYDNCEGCNPEPGECQLCRER